MVVVIATHVTDTAESLSDLTNRLRRASQSVNKKPLRVRRRGPPNEGPIYKVFEICQAYPVVALVSLVGLAALYIYVLYQLHGYRN